MNKSKREYEVLEEIRRAIASKKDIIDLVDLQSVSPRFKAYALKHSATAASGRYTVQTFDRNFSKAFQKLHIPVIVL